MKLNVHTQKKIFFGSIGVWTHIFWAGTLTTWATPPALFFFFVGFFNLGSYELLARAGFESWSLTPKQLGLQAWATCTSKTFLYW
jgi:hypothetical protein